MRARSRARTQVQKLPVRDHNAPPLGVLAFFCRQASRPLAIGPAGHAHAHSTGNALPTVTHARHRSLRVCHGRGSGWRGVVCGAPPGTPSWRRFRILFPSDLSRNISPWPVTSTFLACKRSVHATRTDCVPGSAVRPQAIAWLNEHSENVVAVSPPAGGRPLAAVHKCTNALTRVHSVCHSINERQGQKY